MQSFNKVILTGNLTRDPELRFTQSGLAICKFGLALNRLWTDPQTKEKKEETTFVDVDAFGKQAEAIGQYLKKGRPILLEGRLKMDSWQDKQSGQKRSKLGVVLESFTFLDSGNAGGRSAEAAPTAAPKTETAPASDKAAPEEDDVPF